MSFPTKLGNNHGAFRTENPLEFSVINAESYMQEKVGINYAIFYLSLAHSRCDMQSAMQEQTNGCRVVAEKPDIDDARFP